MGSSSYLMWRLHHPNPLCGPPTHKYLVTRQRLQPTAKSVGGKGPETKLSLIQGSPGLDSDKSSFSVLTPWSWSPSNPPP